MIQPGGNTLSGGFAVSYCANSWNLSGNTALSTRSIQFKGMCISDFVQTAEAVEITFDYAIIIKNMDAAVEDTRWYGAGKIRVDDLIDDDIELPDLPAELTGADVCDNQMIYRNEVVIPVDIHGHVGVKLHFAGGTQAIPIFGERLTLELSGHEKYIEHIKAG